MGTQKNKQTAVLPQERTGHAQLFPRPEPGELVEETPPSFCWLRVPEAGAYTVTVRAAAGRRVWRGVTAENWLVPDIELAPGDYEWNLADAQGRERGWQPFSIAPAAVRRPRFNAAEILDALAPLPRPRHIFRAEDIPEISGRQQAEIAVLHRNLTLALRQGLPEPPRFHRDPQALPYREYFGRHREFCDRNLVACALGHALLRHPAAGAHARELLLTICDWNPAGPCSLLGPWGDEVGLSHARCLPAVYDWLHDLLDDRERLLVERTIGQYTLQCEERLAKIDFGNNPGDSHAGRLPAYIGEAALVLAGSRQVPRPTVERWLNLAFRYFDSFFPFYGGRDGGWAEGTFYGSSYTRWYLPFFLALERACGRSFIERPFYRKVSQFFLHFAPPGRESHPFGDGYWCTSDSPEWPGFFAQNPFRAYAERFGPPLAEEWRRQLAAPEIFNLHLLDVFTPKPPAADRTLTGPAADSRWFRDAGFVSIHSNISDPATDIVLLGRAGKFGRSSHRHADQGSFAIIQAGRTLISPSGYFGRAYGTRHHQEWTRATVAHNCILVDGAGQGTEHTHTGRIVRLDDRGAHAVAELDLGAAYPRLEKYIRRLIFVRPDIVFVADEINAAGEVAIAWLMHSLSAPETQADGSVFIRRAPALACIREISGQPLEYSCTDKFAVDVNDGVPAAFQVGMPDQHHLRWNARPARTHQACFAICMGAAASRTVAELGAILAQTGQRGTS